ncbi:hypothetical protein GX48_03971 [Paracoccidioides brasiliensis]|nr:hypothetical protein GX48_03971 [Paracoccidioides brasiliensis]
MGEVDTFSKSGWMGSNHYSSKTKRIVSLLNGPLYQIEPWNRNGEGLSAARYLIRLVPGVGAATLAPDKRELNQIQNSPFSTQVPLAHNSQSHRGNAQTASLIRLGVGYTSN